MTRAAGGFNIGFVVKLDLFFDASIPLRRR